MEHLGSNCRVCNSSCSDYFDLVYNYGDNFAYKLAAIVPELDLSLSLDPIICKDCAIILDEAYLLRLRCLQTQTNLYNAIYSPSFKKNAEPKITIENDNTVNNSCCKIEICDNEISSINSPQREVTCTIENDYNTVISAYCNIEISDCQITAINSPEKELKLELLCEKYVCDICAKEFHSKDELDVHKCVRIKKKTFKCPYCEKVFKSRQRLNTHRRVHEDLKPFYCEKCAKCFKTRQQLHVHSNCIHEDKELFFCNECGKGFSLKGNLIVHVRTHTGERPFPCPQCNKKFTIKCNMQNHVNRRHRLK